MVRGWSSCPVRSHWGKQACSAWRRGGFTLVAPNSSPSNSEGWCKTHGRNKGKKGGEKVFGWSWAQGRGRKGTSLRVKLFVFSFFFSIYESVIKFVLIGNKLTKIPQVKPALPMTSMLWFDELYAFPYIKFWLILEAYCCIKILSLNAKVNACFTTGVKLAQGNTIQDYTNW